MKKTLWLSAITIVGGWLWLACSPTESSKHPSTVGTSVPPTQTPTNRTAVPTGSTPALPDSAAAVPGTSVPVASASAVVPQGPCPPDMVLTGKFCIDRYEAPNQKGAKPLMMQTADDAETYCKQKGKSLCNEDQWVRACGGPKHWNYPYGISYKRGVCNDDKANRVAHWGKLQKWPAQISKDEAIRLDQSEPSGTRPACVTPEGVADMTGNAAEWVKRTQKNPTNYSHVVKGCFWGQCYRKPHGPACDYVNYAHPKGFRSYEFGFRCCAAPTSDH
jgi:formylglycine-generating enzyme required for sulfatase activity